MKPRILGLIPAKGSSTRLRTKNIRHLGGKTLLEYAVRAMKESGLPDRIIVSTEDKKVAQVARHAGAEVPFIRPEQLAKDPAGVSQVALHALEMLRKQGEIYDTLIITLPTCPFRSAQDIRDAYALFKKKNASFLMSVCRFPHTPFGAWEISEKNIARPFFSEYAGIQSTRHPKAYRPNGAVHIVDVKAFEKAGTYIGQPLFAYEMPDERSIDIDTEEDFLYAEFKLKQQKKKSR
ncbi:MAG: cytidylyltransferase domain-containing protein [Verrucomicrobiota bacterium]